MVGKFLCTSQKKMQERREQELANLTCFKCFKNFLEEKHVAWRIRNFIWDTFKISKIPGFRYTTMSKYPNITNDPNDHSYALKNWEKIEFYPEDKEKMDNMFVDEYIKYGRKLIEENRYYTVPMPNPDDSKTKLSCKDCIKMKLAKWFKQEKQTQTTTQ